jgi:hypothetical protein
VRIGKLTTRGIRRWRPIQEPTLFRVADAFEKATPFRDRCHAVIAD